MLSFLRTWYLHIISIVGILMLISVSALLWREWGKRFPKIEAGAYLGTIEGIAENNPEPQALYIERPSSGEKLLVAVLAPPWEPQLASLVPSNADLSNPVNFMPITVSGSDRQLKFTGWAEEANQYSGRIDDLVSGAKGTWHIKRISSNVPVLDEKISENVRLWLMLKAELNGVDKKIDAAQQDIPKQREEIERLTQSITDGERLKARAQEKLDKIKEEVKAKQKVLAAKQADVQRHEESFEISQRETGMGKLVSLARESIERENRWFDSVIGTVPASMPEGLGQELARAEKVNSVKREIENEHGYIERLMNRQPRNNNKAPAANADDKGLSYLDAEAKGSLRRGGATW